MKTWVLAADFSKTDDLSGATALDASLTKLEFKNLLIFSHNKIRTGNGEEMKLPNFTSRNPMSLGSKATRSLLRKIRSGRIRKIFLNKFGFYNSLMIPHNLRHFLYLKILKDLPRCDFVFVVDSRDLIFQVNPEKLSRDLIAYGALHFFDEREVYFKSSQKKQQIVHSETNRIWINQLLNFQKNEWIDSNEWIINSGCIAGTVEALEEFFQHSSNLISSSVWRFDSILDQAATNVISHKKTLKAVTHPNGRITLNMCGVIEDKCDVVQGMLLIDGSPVPIVHQWDRFGVYDVNLGLQLRRRKYQNTFLGGERH